MPVAAVFHAGRVNRVRVMDVGPPRSCIDWLEEMEMRATWAIVLLASGAAVAAEALEVNVGTIVGAQLLEQGSTELSHGPLHDEVTLGRTVFAGLSLGVQLRERHYLTMEGVIGPYHNDVDRSCITSYNIELRRLECNVHASRLTEHALLYDVHYSFVFGGRGRRPFIGAGIGAKRYSYDNKPFLPFVREPTTSVALHGSIGLEIAGRAPIRLEARCVVIPKNPYLQDGANFQGPGHLSPQYELQVRASVRVPVK